MKLYENGTFIEQNKKFINQLKKYENKYELLDTIYYFIKNICKKGNFEIDIIHKETESELNSEGFNWKKYEQSDYINQNLIELLEECENKCEVLDTIYYFIENICKKGNFEINIIHKETNSELDPENYDWKGYHAFSGYDRNFLDKRGFFSNGLYHNGEKYDEYERDVNGYDKFNLDKDGFYPSRFDVNGIHESGEIYDYDGYDADGIHRNQREYTKLGVSQI